MYVGFIRFSTTSRHLDVAVVAMSVDVRIVTRSLRFLKGPPGTLLRL